MSLPDPAFSVPPLLGGENLKTAARDFTAWLQKKIDAEQNGVFGIFDKWVARVVTRLAALNPDKPWEDVVEEGAARSPQGRAFAEDFFRLRLLLERWKQGRFVSYEQREVSRAHYDPRFGTEFGRDVFLMCQGAPHIMRWRGLPLMKTVFDFALYPLLLGEVRPKTVFEIGSGFGASAIWYADLLKTFGLDTRVHSVDITPVMQQHEGVRFYQGDCTTPSTLFPLEVLQTAPHPWMVVEDAHHNVLEVLLFMHPFLRQGDYLVVEDSDIKKEDLRQFTASFPDLYHVDTRYTDYFGRNATCSNDSIFVRL